MAEPYSIDLENFSLEKFRHTLEQGALLPSRRILKENLSERFAVLKAMGIRNLKELTGALSTKQKIERFAQSSGLPQTYLELLKRQTGIYTPKPVALKAFPGIDLKYTERLAARGLTQSKQLFERAQSKKARAELSRAAKVPGEALLELVQLSDLARAGWVGPIFARLFYEAGADTIEKLAQCAPDTLFAKLIAINAEQKLTKSHFTAKDVALCIEIAKELPITLTY
jgi:hypothetical protein